MDNNSFNVMTFNETEERFDDFKEIICFFHGDLHILENPVKLPCNRYVCLACILHHHPIAKCKLCGEEHVYGNQFIVDRELNGRIKRILNNKKELASFLHEKFTERYNSLVYTLRNFDEVIETKRRKLEEDLEKRIDVLKNHNEILFQESLQKIKSFKNLIINDIERISETNKKSLEVISQSSLLTKTSTLETNDEESLLKKISKSEKHLKTLNCLNRKATMTINQIHFDESNSMTKKLLGCFKSEEVALKPSPIVKCDLQLQFEEMLKTKNLSKQIDVVKSFRKSKADCYIYGLGITYLSCPYGTDNIYKVNARFLISDNSYNLFVLNLIDNKLFKLHFNSTILDIYSLEEDISTSSLVPRGMALNDEGELFVSNKSSNKINKYSRIYFKKIEEFGDDLNDPRGLECFLDYLFICDYSNKRIRVYNNKDSTFIRDIVLIKSLHGDFYPFNVKVKFDRIFVTDFMNLVRVFDLNNFTIVGTIETNSINEPRGLLIDDAGHICVTSRSTDGYILNSFDSYGNHIDQTRLCDNKELFDILLLKNPVNDLAILYMGAGEDCLISTIIRGSMEDE